MSDLVGNPNCWFSHAQAQVNMIMVNVDKLSIVIISLVVSDHCILLPFILHKRLVQEQCDFF